MGNPLAAYTGVLSTRPGTSKESRDKPPAPGVYF